MIRVFADDRTYPGGVSEYSRSCTESRVVPQTRLVYNHIGNTWHMSAYAVHVYIRLRLIYSFSYLHVASVPTYVHAWVCSTWTRTHTTVVSFFPLYIHACIPQKSPYISRIYFPFRIDFNITKNPLNKCPPPK
jgi:hypothetical protein